MTALADRVASYEDAVRFHLDLMGNAAGLAHGAALDVEELLRVNGRFSSPRARRALMGAVQRNLALAGVTPTPNGTDPDGRPAYVLAQRDVGRLSQAHARELVRVAGVASTVYVSAGTCDLAAEEARSDDRSVTTMPDREHLLFDPGLYVFAKPYLAKPVAGVADFTGVVDAALVWRIPESSPWWDDDAERWWMLCMSRTRHAAEVVLNEKHDKWKPAEVDRFVARLGPVALESTGTFRPGFPFDDKTVEDGGYTDDFRFAAAAIARVSHPDSRVAVVDTGRVERKAMKRARHVDPGTLNVIYLPREKKRLVGEAGDGTVRAHRVRAHWRRQPYGPRDANPRPWRWTRVESHTRGSGPVVDTRNVWRA